jgi:hypothetical protein
MHGSAQWGGFAGVRRQCRLKLSTGAQWVGVIHTMATTSRWHGSCIYGGHNREGKMALWNWKKNGMRGYVEIVNDRYRYEVWELWMNQQGQLDHDGKRIVTGSCDTLKEAKQAVIEICDDANTEERDWDWERKNRIENPKDLLGDL